MNKPIEKSKVVYAIIIACLVSSGLRLQKAYNGMIPPANPGECIALNIVDSYDLKAEIISNNSLNRESTILMGLKNLKTGYYSYDSDLPIIVQYAELRAYKARKTDCYEQNN